MFCKKDALRNFSKFTGKHLCRSLFFNKVAGLRPATLLKKKLLHRCFPANVGKFLRTSFLIEHSRWLLLSVGKTKTVKLKPLYKLIYWIQVYFLYSQIKVVKENSSSKQRKHIKKTGCNLKISKNVFLLQEFFKVFKT